MHVLRALLAAEAVFLLTTSVFGAVMPSALAHAAIGSGLADPPGVLPWLCSTSAALALAQLQLAEDFRRPGWRLLVQARLVGDVLLLASILLHTHNLHRYVGIVALTLVFAAARFASVAVADEPRALALVAR